MFETLLIYCNYFADQNVLVSNGTTFSIRNASAIDSGNYTCTAYNSIGHESLQYRVNVLQKPRIVRNPISLSSPPPSTVRLDCGAEGIPKPKIIWLKNGQILNYDSRIKNTEPGIILRHTFNSDSGKYCQNF